MGNPTPAGKENEGSGGEPTEGEKVRKVLTAFFTLPADDQGTTVLQYKQSISELLAQNQRLTGNGSFRKCRAGKNGSTSQHCHGGES